MVFVREEYACFEENLRKKAQVTFKEFTDYLSLVLNLFSYLGEIKVKKVS